HVLFGVSLQPDCVAVSKQHIERGRLGDQSTGGSDHNLSIPLQHIFQGSSFVAPVCTRTIQGVNLSDAATGQPLNLTTQLDERIAKVFGEQAPERGLARAAQANERNPSFAYLYVVTGAKELA